MVRVTSTASIWSRARWSSRRRVDEQGASAVEFALVLPVLILVVGAIIDFGFVFAQQITFNTAVRDAARSGVVPTFSNTTLGCQEIADRTRANIGGGAVGVTPAERLKVAVTITGPAGTCTMPSGSSSSSTPTKKPCTGATAANQNLAVTIAYASSPPFPVPFQNTFNLSSTGSFQCEYQ